MSCSQRYVLNNPFKRLLLSSLTKPEEINSSLLSSLWILFRSVLLLQRILCNRCNPGGGEWVFYDWFFCLYYRKSAHKWTLWLSFIPYFPL